MSNNDDLTRTLSRELQDRSHAMDGSVLHLADVRGRARSIRRRRTATAVAGVAAAVAIIVPTVSLASHSNGKPEPAPATQITSPTQTASDNGSQPAAGVLDVSDLPTGEAPAMDFLRGGVLHEADGGTTDVETTYPADGFVVLSDGSRVWHTATANGQPYVEVQAADGSFQEPVRSTWGLAVNPKHTIAAWVTSEGQVMVYGAGASEPTALGDPIPGDDLRIAAVTGDDCSLACTVDVNVTSGNSGWQPWEASLNGTQKLTDGSYLKINDISEGGLTIGYRKITDFGSCSTLLGGGEFQGFSTCKHTLASFSPDGKLILADPAYHDGFGSGDLAMYNLDGELLFQRQSTAKHQASYQTAEWEDDTHVLASFYEDGTWSIVRVSSDGSMEYAVPPTPGGDMDNPFVLPTGGIPPAS